MSKARENASNNDNKYKDSGRVITKGYKKYKTTEVECTGTQNRTQIHAATGLWIGSVACMRRYIRTEFSSQIWLNQHSVCRWKDDGIIGMKGSSKP